MAVATTLAIVGAATAAAGAGMSFAQASKQNRLASEAETAAAEAMAQARKDLGKNFYAGLSIQKEPYELQREAMMGTAAQAIEAGRESERGTAATAGRIYQAAQEGQGQIRTEMGKELMSLEEKTAAEESRLRDIGVGLSLQEVQGAQQAMSDAEKAKAQYIEGGFGALQTGIEQGIKMAPLYAKQREKKTIPTTATNNFVMQNRQNQPTYDPFGVGKPNQGGMLENPFFTYPGETYSSNPLSTNQPPYNPSLYNPFFNTPKGVSVPLYLSLGQTYQNPLSPNRPSYGSSMYNPFGINF